MSATLLRGGCFVLVLLGVATQAFAQPQWIPAEDTSAESKNGLFKVEAIALSKDHNEPFRWECRWQRKRDGRFERTSSFEVAYPSGMDMQFRLAVSPSGNGFLLDCSTAPAMTFFDPTGRALRKYERGKLSFSWRGFQTEEGHTLRLYTFIPLPQGMTTGGGHGPLETGRFFLPLGAPADEALKKQTMDFLAVPAQGNKADPAVLDVLIRDLDHSEPAVRERVSRRLVDLGGAASKPLEAALASTSAEVRLRAARIREDILTHQMGYENPERNLRLLGALLLYPDAEVAAAASRRLKSLLPEAAATEMRTYSSADLVRSSDWLQKHAEQLPWDAASGRLLWKE